MHLQGLWWQNRERVEMDIIENNMCLAQTKEKYQRKSKVNKDTDSYLFLSWLAQHVKHQDTATVHKHQCRLNKLCHSLQRVSTEV